MTTLAPPSGAPAPHLRPPRRRARRAARPRRRDEAAARAAGCESLRGQSVACYFTKPSTRTRVSVEAAAHRLGALPIMLRPDELQLGRGEPIADTARVLSSYCAAIVIRTFAQADVEAVAAASTAPVINALTDDHHPCQALADLLTLREHFGQLEDVAVAYVGDGNNVAHSLMEAGALAGMDIRVACPPGYEPDAEILAPSAAAGPAARPRRTTRTRRSRAPTPSTPTSGSRWARRPSSSAGSPSSRPTRSRRR